MHKRVRPWKNMLLCRLFSLGIGYCSLKLWSVEKTLGEKKGEQWWRGVLYIAFIPKGISYLPKPGKLLTGFLLVKFTSKFTQYSQIWKHYLLPSHGSLFWGSGWQGISLMATQNKTSYSLVATEICFNICWDDEERLVLKILTFD